MNQEKDWVRTHWRPLMAVTYMVICIFDFIVGPVFWSFIQALQSGNVTLQWNPLTLQAAGTFHIAMGAILGAAAWTRGKEKEAAINLGRLNDE
jgi:hypothetical protein